MLLALKFYDGTSHFFRVPTDVNCLRSVESVAGLDARSKHLRSVLAFQFLVACFDDKVALTYFYYHYYHLSILSAPHHVCHRHIIVMPGLEMCFLLRS